MWKDIEAKKLELDKRRPLTSQSIKALDTWYDHELIYTSNAIEGNTLTRSETSLILEKGITVRGKPLKDHMEVLGHKDALNYVRSLAIQNTPIRETDIREIHRLVVGRSDPTIAGQYSTAQREILGSTVTFPGPTEIAPLMGDFGQWLQNQDATPQNAIETHFKLVAIHPFDDGNGRTARLLMNLVLLRGGYPPLIITPEQRPDYIDTLEIRHLSNDSEPYTAFMSERLTESLDRFLENTSKELQARPNGGPNNPALKR